MTYFNWTDSLFNIPRQYNMGRRAAAREETRRRIVEATAKLHGERGVLGTSWRDIAREADVAVATVYAHFPSLDDLLPACGALVMDRARPPRAEQAAEILDGAETLEDRVERVAWALFSFYERGGPHLEVDVRERQLPGMREWEEHQRATVTALLRAALAGATRSRSTLQAASALMDLPTYGAFRTRGVSARAAARQVARLVTGMVEDTRREETV